jgi:hypothetical protein
MSLKTKLPVGAAGIGRLQWGWRIGLHNSLTCCGQDPQFPWLWERSVSSSLYGPLRWALTDTATGVPQNREERKEAKAEVTVSFII